MQGRWDKVGAIREQQADQPQQDQDVDHPLDVPVQPRPHRAAQSHGQREEDGRQGQMALNNDAGHQQACSQDQRVHAGGPAASTCIPATQASPRTALVDGEAFEIAFQAAGASSIKNARLGWGKRRDAATGVGG